MKRIIFVIFAVVLIYGLSYAGQLGLTKSSFKNNNTNVYTESLQFLFVLQDNVQIEILGDADLNVPYTKGKYVKIKILEGNHKGQFGVVGKDCIYVEDNK
ncbi:MAG TPA: hypothetical protein DCP24_00545 [Nitrospiraceae bacterium]|nr:MAG: hypothetical protein A2Z82_00865 [Nitrospirae bacterium GWA2_46_11]HAK87559.1 hypothetical protein [Nitrospiraceae bacterium]